jgi:hypothetical protein
MSCKVFLREEPEAFLAPPNNACHLCDDLGWTVGESSGKYSKTVRFLQVKDFR